MPQTKGYLTTVGVVVGRFQVDALHDGHLSLLRHVANNHARVVIFIGIHALRADMENPMSYEHRLPMIAEACPQAVILPLRDTASDEVWSQALDSMLYAVTGSAPAVLYSGRMGFHSHYHGLHPVEERHFVEGDKVWSGTQRRAELGAVNIGSASFRSGIIHAVVREGTRTDITIDCAAVSEGKLLVGKKASEKLYRLPGGFWEPEEGFQATATRECQEETGLIVQESTWEYVGDFEIADWRSQVSHKIRTILFYADVPWSNPVKAGDDLAVAEWRWILELKAHDFVPEHRGLFDAAQKLYEKKLSALNHTHQEAPDA